jgi:hypothetical protein
VNAGWAAVIILPPVTIAATPAWAGYTALRDRWRAWRRRRGYRPSHRHAPEPGSWKMTPLLDRTEFVTVAARCELWRCGPWMTPNGVRA